MVPQLSILVPLYKEMVALKGINHIWGIVLVSATFHLPLSIYMFTNFIKTIPSDLDEAAMIDGCSRFQAFFRIILPCLKSTTVSVIILTGVGIWNDYLAPTIFVQDEKWYTLQVVIRSFNDQYAVNSNYPLIMAASVVSLIPVLIVFLSLQKYFVQGVATSGLKG